MVPFLFFATIEYLAYVQTDHVLGLILAFIAIGAFGLWLMDD